LVSEGLSCAKAGTATSAAKQRIKALISFTWVSPFFLSLDLDERLLDESHELLR
jgi:hypothetical protein